MKFSFGKGGVDGGTTTTTAKNSSGSSSISSGSNKPQSSPAPTNTTTTASPLASIGSKKFSFSNPFSKSSGTSDNEPTKKSKKNAPPAAAAPAAPAAVAAVAPTSPPRSNNNKWAIKKFKAKKQKQAPPVVYDDDEDEDEEDQQYYEQQQQKQRSRNNKSRYSSSSKRSSSSSSCCSCSNLLGMTCFLLIGTVIGVLVWRYGPWAKDSATVVSLDASTTSCPECCNGLESNCDIPVNELLFPMVHNAHSSYDNNFVAANNAKPFEEALVAGYRGLQLSTCVCESLLSKVLLERDADWGLGESNVGFCHTACGAGVRDPKDVLTSLRTFIEENPREVLIIELDMNDGSSTDLRAALQYSGLLEYVYYPQQETNIIEDWPTLGELIYSNKRIILFGIGDGMASCPASQCHDGILYTNDYIVQTATDGSDLTKCEGTVTGDVIVGYFQMNNYKESSSNIPTPSKARELNSYSALKERLESCKGSRRPNLLSVDFWDEGEVLKLVKDVNLGKL
ncbi:hypothetical protein ACHAWU_004427 [Discostella pseudostelligera]|uniref:Uncharacterized protein n=1 Tax=Discostella pseudostelligera TaxID=259834 RepID=A0ABD3M5L1_9STRA